MKTMELLFYDRFILMKSLFKRIKTPYIIIACYGAEDGEKLELYINGKISESYTIVDGKITIPVEQGNTYRLSSNKFPYGVKFNTTDARDNTNDILLFHTTPTDGAEIKNIYRIIENLCSKVKEQEKQIAALSGYQTE